MLIFSVSFQTLTEARKEKGYKIPKMLSSDAHAGTPDTRVSAKSRRVSTVLEIPALIVDQNCRDAKDTSVLVTTVSHVKRSLHQTRGENEVPTKTEKNRINAKSSRVGTFVRYTARDVEVDCQNRDSLKEDVCSCLAPGDHLPTDMLSLWHGGLLAFQKQVLPLHGSQASRYRPQSLRSIRPFVLRTGLLASWPRSLCRVRLLPISRPLLICQRGRFVQFK